jgi:hypothetical protein
MNGDFEDFDLDAVAAVLLPWRLRIKIRGTAYATRSPSVGEVAALMELSKASGRERETIGIVSGLFVDPKPDLDKLDFTLFLAAARRIVEYAKAYYAKNSPAIATTTGGDVAVGQIRARSTGES